MGYLLQRIGNRKKMARPNFWDMTPCSPVRCSRRVGGTYRLHLQGLRVQLYGLHGVISQKMILFKTTAVQNLKSYKT
jgi:hypothetical protein